MDAVGHVDPAVTTGIYARTMRRDPGDREALRALVAGGQWDLNGTRAGFEAPAEG